MRTIEFSSTEIYESEGRGKGPAFEAGQRYELRDDLAERWVRRGKAVYVDGAPPAAVETRGKSAPRTRLPSAADVVIPDDWQKLKSHEVKDLAAALAEPAPANRNEAHDIVEAELAARAAA